MKEPLIALPRGYVPEPLERITGGGTDDTGLELPRCLPDRHIDGRHAMTCFAGAIGYRKVGDGTWERNPPHPLDIAGSRFVYEGHIYIRPVDRGIVLDDDSYLESLPDGDYEAKIELVRVRDEASS